jgi:hypothetical protein
MDIEKHRALASHRVTDEAMTSVELAALDFACRRSTLGETKTGRSWQRFEVDWPTPPTVRRRYKASLDAMPIAAAMTTSGAAWRLYVPD